MLVIHLRPEGFTFSLTKPRKCGKPSTPGKVNVAEFKNDELLCPLRCLRTYIKETDTLRELSSASENLLFISYTKPHKPVGSATISRWLRTTINQAGIDSSIFKGHSVRGAATSLAASTGLSSAMIMEMADWSNKSTFNFLLSSYV